MTLFKLSQVPKGTATQQHRDDKNDHGPNVIHHNEPCLDLLKSPKTNKNTGGGPHKFEASSSSMVLMPLPLQCVTNTANKYYHTATNKTNGQNSSNQQTNNNQNTNGNENEHKDDDHVAPNNNNNNNMNTNNNNDDENEKKRNRPYIASSDSDEEAQEEEEEETKCDEEQMDRDISDICAELSLSKEFSDILSVDESTESVISLKPIQIQSAYCKNKNNNKKRKTKKRKKLKGSDRLLSASYNPLPSYRAQGNIQISKQFTAELIPSSICENISNLYGFMDKCTALCLMDDHNTDDLRIFNYGFHSKLTGESLFCVVRRQDVAVNASRGYKWKMMSKLYRFCDLIDEFWSITYINSASLPSSLYDTVIYKSYFASQQRILSVIRNVQHLDALINSTQWHRVDIFNRINNKRRMHLFLTKPEFMKECRNYVLNCSNTASIRLIPILMFNNECNEYWIEHVWMIKIDVEDISIGISFKYTMTKQVRVTGIHLDKQHLMDQHEVILPNHECHCFDTFSSNINYLSIGNPDDSLNKIKYYKQQIEELSKCKESLVEENKKLSIKQTSRSRYIYYPHNNQYNNHYPMSNNHNHIIHNANINEQMFKM